MGIFPTDDMLSELLRSCGKTTEDDIDIISFDLFARSVALLLEENAAEKGSTSSQNGESIHDGRVGGGAGHHAG